MTRSDRRYTWPRRQTAFWGKRLYIQAEIYVRQSAAGTACRKHRQRPQTGHRSAAPPGGGLIRRYRRYSGRSRSRAASACQAEILHAPAGSWSLASLRFVLFEQEYTICNISLPMPPSCPTDQGPCFHAASEVRKVKGMPARRKGRLELKVSIVLLIIVLLIGRGKKGIINGNGKKHQPAGMPQPPLKAEQ